jgi:zinc finger protein
MTERNELTSETCPVCKNKTLTLSELDREVPYFGKVYVFSMSCSHCKYHKADIEAAEKHKPAKFTIDIESEEDLSIRIVKSSQATIRIPHVTTITPGPASNGYVTNVEGIFNRVKQEIESARDQAEDNEDRKKAKNLLKKLQKIMWGQHKQRFIIEDPTGNSAIISDKAVKSRL